MEYYSAKNQVKTNEYCPCCGQKIVEYKHKLNKVLIKGLWKLRINGGVGKLKELELTNNEFANFQKLKYFGLVRNEKGYWVLTQNGLNFLNGISYAPSYVITRNGLVIEQGELIIITRVKDYCQLKEEWEYQARGGAI